jgi:polyisoprenoid-binding protein YceI
VSASLGSFWRRWRNWIIGGVLALVLLFVGGPFVYINFIREDAPARLTFEDATTSTGAGSGDTSSTTAAPAAASNGSTAPSTTATAAPAASPIEGTWAVGPGSQVGYRVDEVLFGQNAEAVGRTPDVTGQVAIAGTTVQSASFTADMTTVTSDEGRRDNQFNGRIMATAQFPTATLVLTQPIQLDSVPDNLVEITEQAAANLTLRGTTQPVTFDLKARRNGATIEVNGAIPITFADYGIPNPSTAGISTEDHGELEFLLVLTKA